MVLFDGYYLRKIERDSLYSLTIKTMNPASRVFGSRDLFGSIYAFIRPEWVNPFFPSIEGVLLDGREELLGTKFEPLFRSYVGLQCGKSIYQPSDTYEFRNISQLAMFIEYYVNNYEDYIETSSFSAIVNYLFSPFLHPYHRRISHDETRDIEFNHRLFLRKLCQHGDVDRLCEYVKGVYPTRLPYSFGHLYDEWMDHTERTSYELLTRVLETELDLFVAETHEHRGIPSLDTYIREILRDWGSLGINQKRLMELYEVRMKPIYQTLGQPASQSSIVCPRVFQYASVGCFEVFIEYGNYTYVKDCLDAYESMSVRQLHDFAETWSSHLDMLAYCFNMSYRFLCERRVKLHSYDTENTPEEDALIERLERVQYVLEKRWTGTE